MEATLNILVALILSALAGFLQSVLGWLKTTDAFSTRANIAAIITAVIAGVLIGVPLASTDIFTNSETPGWQVIVGWVAIFGSAGGFGVMAQRGVNAIVEGRLASKPA